MSELQLFNILLIIFLIFLGFKQTLAIFPIAYLQKKGNFLAKYLKM